MNGINVTNLKKQNIDQICHLCLNFDTTLNTIFSEEKHRLEQLESDSKNWMDDANNILNFLSTMTNIKIQMGDEFPKLICNLCSDMIESFIQFRNNCISSYQTLQRINLDNDNECFERPTDDVKLEYDVEPDDVLDNISSDEEENVCENLAIKTETKKSLLKKYKLKETNRKHHLSDDEDCISTTGSESSHVMDNESMNSSEGEWAPKKNTKDLKRSLKPSLKRGPKPGSKRGPKRKDQNGSIEISAAETFEVLPYVERKKPGPKPGSRRKPKADEIGEIIKTPPNSKSKRGRKRIPDHLKKKKIQNRCITICPICGESRKNMTTHLQSHSTDRPFDCSFCELKFKTIVNLKRHEATHTNTRAYKCKEEGCNRAFINYTSLALHKIQHTGEKNYACNICDRRFVLPTTLKHHLQTHIQERKYECSVCEKKFLTGTDYRQHYRIHTGEKPYRCKFCDQKYRTAGMVGLHVKKYHAELIVNYTEKYYHVDL